MLRETEKPATAHSLGGEIYERIREDIISCVLSPGQSCSEGQLAELYCVGKAPIRSALAALAREGLVTSQPRQGHVISSVTIQSVNDVFGVRLIVEPATARSAAGRADIDKLTLLHSNLTKEHIALSNYRSKAQKGGSIGDHRHERRWLEANSEFHIEIARATNNERLIRITAAILEESRRAIHLLFSVYDQANEMRDDHPDLIDALHRGDGDAAESIARDHIERSRRIVLDALLDNRVKSRQARSK